MKLQSACEINYMLYIVLTKVKCNILCKTQSQNPITLDVHFMEINRFHQSIYKIISNLLCIHLSFSVFKNMFYNEHSSNY